MDGITPGQFKREGGGIRIRCGFHRSPFGACLVGVTDRGVCHLSFLDAGREEAVARLRSQWPGATLVPDSSSTRQVFSRVFAPGGAPERGLRVLLRGTPFQLKVWEALLRIPPGSALSYRDLAAWMGHPRASRAVGSALARNPVAYLIPCHRVIRATGAITGYRWGAERKRAILAWESARRGIRDGTENPPPGW